MHKSQPIVILSAFYKPFASGAELCVEEMVKHHGKHEIIVVTSRLSTISPKIDLDSDVKIIRVGFGCSWDKYLFPFFCIWPVIQQRPRIVHAVMESYAGIGLMLLKRLKPSLFTILTLQSGNLDEDPKLKKGVFAWIWKSIHTTPDKITAISHYLAQRAIKMRNDNEEIQVIPNGVDLSLVQGMARETIGTRIVSISRPSREKGVDVLIRAFAEVAKKHFDVELHIIGDGSERGELENLVNDFGLQDRVVFYGRRPHEEALQLIQTGKVFALLSRGEGQGIVLLEAASVGLPCVATNVGGIPEAVIDDETGFLVPNEDFKSAADKILELLQDEKKRNQLGMNAIIFSKRFDWNECIKRYIKLWDESIITQ